MRLIPVSGGRRTKAALALMGLATLWACDGENLFSVPGTPGATGPAGADTEPPVVEITTPRGDALSAKPLGDSVFVAAHVTDDTGVSSVRFFGVAFRGDKDLGTDEVVQRFEEKVVTLPAAVEDTTLTRYLLPTADSVKETAYIIVEAADSTGNVHADTVSMVLGGPDVTLLNVEDGQSIQAGLNMSALVRAQDPLGIIQVRLDVTGAFTASVVKDINPVADSVVVDTIIPIPAGVTGAIEVVATARNSLDVAGTDGPVSMQVIAAGAGDTLAPRLKHLTTAPDRLELQDLVSLEITGADDSQGSGVATVGYTVLAISPSRGDTLIRSDQTSFSPARTGTVSTTFEFKSFNVDSLSLPDTLVFEITSWMVDADGNCGAATGLDTLVSLPCGNLTTGETVAQDRTGERLTRSVVAGLTVRLPAGGTIMDAVVDTTRRNLLLSNFDRDRIEVFRLQDETFLTAIPVGSEPWGLTLNNCPPLSPTAGCGDTLIVGNSGGTNLSNVYLGPSDGLGPAFEDANRRFLTPDVVLFDVEQVIDDAGFIRHNVTVYPKPDELGFSDRPQFVARDSTGRILYSTKVVPELEQVGTIRKGEVPDPAGGPEVKLFVEHAAMREAEDFIGIAHIDGVTVCSGCASTGDDQITVTDHQPGFFGITLSQGPDARDTATAGLAAQGSDILVRNGRWSVENIGFSDTTFVAASGDGGWVVFGEGALEPTGRVIMYEAAQDRISTVIEVWDRMTNDGESVRGIGLNYDGTLGVARGRNAYFFTTDLRLQGVADIEVSGGAGAVLHPLHANALSLTNPTGEYRPDTHLAFVGTGERTIDIYDTFHFFRSGRIFLRDVVVGPLRASLPFPEDNVDPSGTPFQCATTTVTDQTGRTIGEAVEIFQGGDFNSPWPADGGAGGTEDRCVVLKLYGTTDSGGVVVIDVRKSDILRDHPARN